MCPIATGLLLVQFYSDFASGKGSFYLFICLFVSVVVCQSCFRHPKRVAGLREEVAGLRASGRFEENITKNVRPINSTKIVSYSVTKDLKQTSHLSILFCVIIL